MRYQGGCTRPAGIHVAALLPVTEHRTGLARITRPAFSSSPSLRLMMRGSAKRHFDASSVEVEPGNRSTARRARL